MAAAFVGVAVAQALDKQMLAWLQLVGVAILTLISLLFRFIERLFIHRDEIALPKRVAVIGGGIAGFGAAHALCHSGIEVDLFEACDEAGGNAKTHEWRDGARTGLSVLAWPVQYFRNYGALLKQLGLKTTPVELRFFLRRKDGDSFVHGRTEAQLGNGRALAPVTSLHPLPHCLLQHNRRKVLVVRRLRCDGLVFRWCAHKRLAARPERRAAEYGLD